jgi:hypothetical protein
VNDLPIRVLAVLGAAAVGAFGTGGAIKLLGRLTFTRNKLPNWVMHGMRSLGAIVLGWLAVLWMFGGGFGGFGGPGGPGVGAGFGLGKGNVVAQPQPEKEKATEPGPGPAPAAETVQVEVLGPDALKRLAGKKGGEAERRYRVDAGNGPRLMTLDELKNFLRERLQATPRLRQVSLVLYADSPDSRTPAVDDLRRWIEEDLPPRTKGETIVLNIVQPDKNAPAK